MEGSTTNAEVKQELAMEDVTNLSTGENTNTRVESLEEQLKCLKAELEKEKQRNFELQRLNPSLVPGETKRSVGRPANIILYRDEMIDGKHCVIGTVHSKGEDLNFIIDKDDEERVKARQWYCATGGKYVACVINIENRKRYVYLHNFIMDRIFFPGKCAKETVDHINRNGLDNRKCNLRVISQTLQNINQKKKARKVEMPPEIGELPRHIWYVKSNGKHGERFAVEFKSEGIVKRTTSARNVSLKEKFAQALKLREELYNQFPHLRS